MVGLARLATVDNLRLSVGLPTFACQLACQPSPVSWLANRSSPSRGASHAQVSEGWCLFRIRHNRHYSEPLTITG